jgi:DnaJ-class molecular chaperone with C-terminal Zn finger domain
MNQSVGTKVDPVLKTFNEDVAAKLGSIAQWLGLDGISLQMEPKFTRHKVTVGVANYFTSEFYSKLYPGEATFPGAPTLKKEYLSDYLKEEADKRFRGLVAKERLQDEVLAGNVFEPQRIVCDEVLATSYEDCNNCNRGLVTCSGCNGHGTNDCNNCAVYLHHPKGYVTCWGCHGTGGSHDAGTGKWYNCSVCHGWKRKLCYTCGGSAEIRCTGCGGDGTQYCGSCGGHAFFTRAHGYRATMESKANIDCATLNETDREWFFGWLKMGLPGWTEFETGTVLPCARLDLAVHRYDGWNDGVFTAMYGFNCHVTTADVTAKYPATGASADFHYRRFNEAGFLFTPFLDHVVAEVFNKIEDSGSVTPSQYLERFAKIPGLQAGLRASGTSKENKDRFETDAAHTLRGVVRAELIIGPLYGYLATVSEMEKDVSNRIGRDVVLTMSAAWVAAWFGGLFEYIATLQKNHSLLAAVALVVVVANVSGLIVRFLTRRKIKRETGATATYSLSRRGKLMCFLGGIVFALAGGASTIYG